jgi:AraC family transcriptional regulator of adaptative response/methylated-DNA-[protein]-cysteine methyltransferase
MTHASLAGDYERVRRAIEFLRANAARQPDLGAVAAHLALSPAHFQRLFRRWAGVSPKRFLQYLNASQAKQLLRKSVSVLDTAFSVGLSGPGRLHDLILSSEAVTPGQYARRGAGLTIRYGLHDSPFGRCLLASTERGLCALRFVDGGAEDEALAELRQEWPRARCVADESATASAARSIFAGRPARLLLFLEGTNLQLKVWEALLRLPEGTALSYRDLAERIGSPRATRAVASAVGANPIAYLIPCHRVLRAAGELGGYRWGLERKALMLAREQARGDAAQAAARPLAGSTRGGRSHG